MGSEQVGLQGDAIAIAAGELPDRLDAGIEQQPTDRQAAHPHHRPAAVGDIDGMDDPGQGPGMGQGAGGIAAAGGITSAVTANAPSSSARCSRKTLFRLRPVSNTTNGVLAEAAYSARTQSAGPTGRE